MNPYPDFQLDKIYISQFHGCAYAVVKDLDSDGDFLITTPMFKDDTFSLNEDDWTEVDEMALLGEEPCHREHIDHVWSVLNNG